MAVIVDDGFHSPWDAYFGEEIRTLPMHAQYAMFPQVPAISSPLSGPHSFQCVECRVLFSPGTLSPRMARGLRNHQPSYQQSSAAFRDVFRVLDEVEVIVNGESTVSDVAQDSKSRFLLFHHVSLSLQAPPVSSMTHTPRSRRGWRG